jgi:hypothetical protein
MAYSADDNPGGLVLKNLGALLPIALLFVGWLASTWKKIGQQKTANRPPTRAAADEAERTRRVQAEVRRRIAERQGAPPPAASASRQAPAPPMASAPRPAPSPPVSRRLGGSVTEVFEPAPPEAMPPAADYSAEQARQERLTQELAAIEAGLPPPIASHQAYAPPPASPPPVQGWLVALRDPVNVRRAIVLREVLGPPVALR